MSGDQLDFHQGNKETLTGTLHDPGATTGHVLTVQADKSIKAKPGGGGGSGVQVVTVPVSSAQILDLFNTPVVLIPGVAGNVTVVTGSGLVYLAGATPYTDNGGAVSAGTPAVTPGTIQVWAFTTGAGFWDQAASQVVAEPFGNAGLQAALAEYDGQDVVLSDDTANPTLGDGTLLVTLSYFLAPTV